MNGTSAIILAAGKSTRMQSGRPKVLHEVCGRSMLSYVMNACRLAGVDRVVVVVGHGKDEVKASFCDEQDVSWVEQAAQKGTGHAVLCCREALKGCSGAASAAGQSVLVVAGDMPLVRREPLANLLEARRQSDAALTLATTVLDDPKGYGRIVRDSAGRLEAIIEEGNCTEQQRALREVNPSYYCFDGGLLFEALDRVKCDPSKGEYYLTDTIGALRSLGRKVTASVRVPAEDAMGINSRLDLATVSRVMQDRIQLALMNEGVTIVDPDNTWIEADVAVGPEVTIRPFTFIGAGATLGEGSVVGPFARIDAGETVDAGAVVGPLVCSGAGAV